MTGKSSNVALATMCLCVVHMSALGLPLRLVGHVDSQLEAIALRIAFANGPKLLVVKIVSSRTALPNASRRSLG